MPHPKKSERVIMYTIIPLAVYMIVVKLFLYVLILNLPMSHSFYTVTTISTSVVINLSP